MLTPSVRGRYIGTYTRDYAETGSTQNIAYQSAFSHALEERAEVRLTHTTRLPFGERFSSYVQAAAIATQRIGSGAVSASILGTEISIQNSAAASLAGLSLGTGLDVDLTRQITAYAGVDAMEYTDASKAIAARLGLRVAF